MSAVALKLRFPTLTPESPVGLAQNGAISWSHFCAQRYPGIRPIDFVVGSRGRIIVRPSQLDPDVRLWVHPAPDVLSLSFCSCGCNRGSFRVPLKGCFSSNFHGFHQHDVNVPSRY